MSAYRGRHAVIRRICPACGKNIVVTRQGWLRQHKGLDPDRWECDQKPTPLTQWYTNRADAKRGARGDVMALVEHRGRWLSFYVPATDPNGIGLLARVSQVERRSAERIDRLARDWIAHGVAPTLRHERGVGTEADCTCDPWSPDGHESHCAMLAWCRKERRARRVVRVQL